MKNKEYYESLNLNKYYSRENLVAKVPLFSLDKKDFIIMLNIMYEDQYLTHFVQKENYREEEHYEMGDEEYLNKFCNNGYLDVKDVKYLEEYPEEEYMKNFFRDKDGNFSYKVYYLNYEIFDSFKDFLMSERYPFIETLDVIYEISSRNTEKYYRKFIVFDTINKNYIIPKLDNFLDNEVCAYGYVDCKNEKIFCFDKNDLK